MYRYLLKGLTPRTSETPCLQSSSKYSVMSQIRIVQQFLNREMLTAEQKEFPYVLCQYLFRTADLKNATSFWRY